MRARHGIGSASEERASFPAPGLATPPFAHFVRGAGPGALRLAPEFSYSRAMGTRNSTRKPKPRARAFSILPQPKRLTPRPGEFRLRQGMSIELPACEATLDRKLLVAATQARQDVLQKTGVALEIERPRNPDPKSPAITCRLDRQAALSPRAATARDAYQLKVRSNNVVITAPTADGIRHGLQSFCQLVTPTARVAAVDIRDQPDFRDRGIMLDVSRGKVPTQEDPRRPRRTLLRVFDSTS